MNRVERSLLHEENFSKPAKTGLSALAGEDSHVMFYHLDLIGESII